jgi:xanthine dehydrogenase accessory factor
MKLDILRRLNEARARRAATVLLTDMASGEERLVVESDGYAGDPLREEISARFRSGASGMGPAGGPAAGTFFTVHLPPPRLVVIGAAHISQALAPMAKVAGFDMTVIDPRTAFATPERFPDVALVAEWPEVALPKVGLDEFTALAVVSHDPKIDDLPLTEALRAGCFYVGALGSRKTHARRLERLRAAGVDEAKLARIHAPIGVAIRAQSPAEIAVAILAQVIGALRSRGLATAEAAA